VDEQQKGIVLLDGKPGKDGAQQHAKLQNADERPGRANKNRYENIHFFSFPQSDM
jgi:hypothetical protein